MYRTRGGAVPWIGRLEVYVDGEWGTVCDLGFDVKDANIACRAMGYGSAKRVWKGAAYGRGVGKIHYSNMRFDQSMNNDSIMSLDLKIVAVCLALYPSLTTILNAHKKNWKGLVDFVM